MADDGPRSPNRPARPPSDNTRRPQRRDDRSPQFHRDDRSPQFRRDDRAPPSQRNDRSIPSQRPPQPQGQPSPQASPSPQVPAPQGQPQGSPQPQTSPQGPQEANRDRDRDRAPAEPNRGRSRRDRPRGRPREANGNQNPQRPTIETHQSRGDRRPREAPRDPRRDQPRDESQTRSNPHPRSIPVEVPRAAHPRSIPVEAPRHPRSIPVEAPQGQRDRRPPQGRDRTPRNEDRYARNDDRSFPAGAQQPQPRQAPLDRVERVAFVPSPTQARKAPRSIAPPEPPPESSPRPVRAPVYLPIAPKDEPDETTQLDPLFNDASWDGEGTLSTTVTVRLARTGRSREFDAGEQILRQGDVVAVEADGGATSLGVVTQPCQRCMCKGRLNRVLRKTTEAELNSEPREQRREREVFRIARHVATALDLPIKIVRAESEGNGKTVVYFASEERVDFRELFRRVSAAAQGRIELRQIGVRDAAKSVGGVGPCGLTLCCSTFLREFAPVSIKMAKDQGLVLNPTRVSGLCGRLLCCLTYEDAHYRTQRKLLPKLGKRVVTPSGPGKVRDVDVLAQSLRVLLDTGEIITLKPSDISPMFPSQGDTGDDHDNQEESHEPGRPPAAQQHNAPVQTPPQAKAEPPKTENATDDDLDWELPD